MRWEEATATEQVLGVGREKQERGRQREKENWGGREGGGREEGEVYDKTVLKQS